MQRHSLGHKNRFRHNTDADELVINRFERADFIHKAKSHNFREQLLQKANIEEYLKAFPAPKRKYRYHSVINVRIEDITSYEKNFLFLKKMKQKSDYNSELLLADCLEVYSSLLEGPQKDALYDLVGLVVQLRDTDIPKLRDSECEKIFRRIQSIVNLVNLTKRERATSIEFQYKEENSNANQANKSKLASRVKFLIARFEFIIATLGHFVHYNRIANTLQKKVHNRTLPTKAPNSVFSTSVFTSMETKTKKDSIDKLKRQLTRGESKLIGRRDSFESPTLVERNRSFREEADEALTESKFQQVKSYFKWKLEKWKDQDLEEIVTVCRICSKSMSAKIMKKHSLHCKKVAEEERLIKSYSKKISNIMQKAIKERHNANVELMIDKKLLTSLRAAQLELSRETDQPQLSDSDDSMPSTPSLLASPKITFNFTEDGPDFLTLDHPEHVQNIRDELKAFDQINHRGGDVPLLFVTPEDNYADNDGNDLFVLEPADCSVSKRKDSQNSECILDKHEADALFSKEIDNMSLEGENKETDLLVPSLSPTFLERAKSSHLQAKNGSNLSVIAERDSLGLLLNLSPSTAIPTASANRASLRRSNTSLSANLTGSPLIPSSRRCSKRVTELRGNDGLLKRNSDTQTVAALRDRLEKIKEKKNLIKGYDILLIYAKKIDAFHQFSSEARIVYEEAKDQLSGILGKIKNNFKFESLVNDFTTILLDKLEYIKLVDVSRRELKLLEIATIDTSESNRDESGTAGTPEVKSSWDSIELGSNQEFSPTLLGRKSISMPKSVHTDLDKKKMAYTPDDSPVTRKSRSLRSKSVQKRDGNDNRFEQFDRSIQKVIKKIRRQREAASYSPPGKTNRSRFYRNSLFGSSSYEEVGSEKSHFELDNKDSGTMTSGINENVEEEESSEESSPTSRSSDENDEFNEDDLNEDLELNTVQIDKSSFSDDETNLRRCAKNQEDGLTSLITIKDFEFVKLISKGAYGRVWLVKRKITGDHYAMKIINFADRKNMNQIDSLKTEKKVFEKLNGDFVVKAVFTFVHNNYLCIVMELMIGGDFGHVLEKLGALEEDDAAFYIAEIIVALGNLHKLGIVHRDLKPDNVLLDKNGHIKLTDFGLSEVGVQKHQKPKNGGRRSSIFNILSSKTTATLDRRFSLNMSDTINALVKKPLEKAKPVILSDEFSTIPEVDEEAPEPLNVPKGNRVIGTPDYIAPEIIHGTCYDDPCIDWWSVGVLLFELIVGIPPFNDPDVEVVFKNIVKRNIPWDDLQIGYDEGCITPEAKDLIDRLLELDRTKRLGAKGVEEIKSHPFFKKINWDEILKSKAPIIPVTNNDIDVSNFEKESKKFNQSELENPFHEKSVEGMQPVTINKETFELARVDILHEENEKVVKEATNTISQEELEKMRKARLVNRKWSVFD